MGTAYRAHTWLLAYLQVFAPGLPLQLLEQHSLLSVQASPGCPSMHSTQAGAPLQSLSAQSTAPSQSLSRPSSQVSSVPTSVGTQAGPQEGPAKDPIRVLKSKEASGVGRLEVRERLLFPDLVRVEHILPGDEAKRHCAHGATGHRHGDRRPHRHVGR